MLSRLFRHAIRLSALIVLAGCSHDAQRANPLDAALTPAVELQASLDRAAQTASLTWARYSGRDFGYYLVLRQVSDLVAVDTLARFSNLTDTTYTDTALNPGTDYLYHVSVVNSAGLEASSEVQRIAAFDLPLVRITDLVLDAPSATANLSWSRYEGPDFKAYRIARGAGSESRLVATLAHIDSTQWQDSGLRGSTEYSYTVNVETQRGHSSASEPVAGALHSLVGSWPLGDEDPLWPQDVRLQWRDGALEVLLFGGAVDVYRRDADGGLLEREQLFSVALFDMQRGIRASAAPVLTDGTRLIAWVGRELSGLLQYRDGALVQADEQLAFDPDPNTDISGRIRLASVLRAAHFRSVRFTTASGSDVDVDISSMKELVTRADLQKEGAILAGWIFSGSYGRRGDWLTFMGNINEPFYAQQVDASDASIGVSAHVIGRPGAQIQLGADEPERLTLNITGPFSPLYESGEASLVWTRPGRSDTLRVPLPGFDLPIQVSMQTVDDAPQASMTYPVIRGQAPGWLRQGLASIDQHTAWTNGINAHAVDAQGTITTLGELSSAPVDMRTWQLEDESRPRIAVCLPDENQVRFGSVFRGSRWTDALRGATIGLRIGAGGTLFHPLSVAAGPDGRMYVLDAGHGRIVVFDRDGGYITEFGVSGSGDGEFNFGPWNTGGPEYRGSLAVDDEGFIYVADMGNRRIQKFAP